MHYFNIIFILFIINNIQFILSTYEHSNWIRGLPDLPRSLWEAAVGYNINNNEIILTYQADIISYNIEDNNFTIHPDISPSNRAIDHIPYTQIGNTLYLVEKKKRNGSIYYDTNCISALDLDTKQFTRDIFQSELQYTAYGSCLCSNDNYLIYSGGQLTNGLNNPSNSVEIYSISNNEWLTNVPSMISPRYEHSCIVYQDTIYQFGGQTCGNIEKLYIGNGINSDSSWTIVNNHVLSTHGFYSRAVIYNDNIYIFNRGNTIVDIIDPLTDEITQFMPLPNIYDNEDGLFSVITVDDKMYVFGGPNNRTGGGGYHGPTDRWDYVEFFETTTTTTLTPTAPPIVKNCDCVGDMVSLTVRYMGECTADITGYYDKKKRVDEIFCIFDNVMSGDYITCTAAPDYDVFKSKMYFDINCVQDRRRLKKKSSSSSSDEKRTKNYCRAKLDTSCRKNIIGMESKGCNDLKVLEYISGDGAICDETVIHNAVINDEITENNNPLNTKMDQDSSTVFSVVVVVIILFIVVLMIAAYCICIISKKLNGNNVNVVVESGQNQFSKINTIVNMDENSNDSEENNLTTMIR